jgi:hypothetical protein
MPVPEDSKPNFMRICKKQQKPELLIAPAFVSILEYQF